MSDNNTAVTFQKLPDHDRAGSPLRKTHAQATVQKPQRASDGAPVHCDRHRPEL